RRRSSSPTATTPRSERPPPRRGAKAARLGSRRGRAGATMRRMRLAWLVLLALAGTAHADRKLQALRPDYVREVAACRVQARGMTKVQGGAAELAKIAEPAERAELERDVEQLAAGLARVQEHCDEVAAMIAFLDANAAAPYRRVERELDARYTRIVKLRAASKQTIEALEPTPRKPIAPIP